MSRIKLLEKVKTKHQQELNKDSIHEGYMNEKGLTKTRGNINEKGM